MGKKDTPNIMFPSFLPSLPPSPVRNKSHFHSYTHSPSHLPPAPLAFSSCSLLHENKAITQDQWTPWALVKYCFPVVRHSMQNITYNPQRQITVTVVSDSSKPSMQRKGFQLSSGWETVVDDAVLVEPTHCLRTELWRGNSTTCKHYHCLTPLISKIDSLVCRMDAHIKDRFKKPFSFP